MRPCDLYYAVGLLKTMGYYHHGNKLVSFLYEPVYCNWSCDDVGVGKSNLKRNQ